MGCSPLENDVTGGFNGGGRSLWDNCEGNRGAPGGGFSDIRKNPGVGAEDYSSILLAAGGGGGASSTMPGGDGRCPSQNVRRRLEAIIGGSYGAGADSVVCGGGGGGGGYFGGMCSSGNWCILIVLSVYICLRLLLDLH